MKELFKDKKKLYTAIISGAIIITAILGAFGVVDLVKIDNVLEAVIGERLFTEPEPTQIPVVEEISASGDFWTVYFTTPGGEENHIENNLVELINSAQSTIHIASFEFNLDNVAEALIAAHQRGVEVQWVTDDEHGLESDEEEGHGQFEEMEDAGIEIKDDQRGALMHNKFWIFDGNILWTGSTNITYNGTLLNNNNVIVFESTALADIYEREFQEMWTDGEFGPRSSSTIDLQNVKINQTAIQVLFGAEDEVGEQLTEMLSQAESSIRFMAFAFTHDDMGLAILDRNRAGVDVAGIFEKRGSETEYSEMTSLFCGDIPVRQDGNSRTFHHKVIIIDDHIVITGSFNFSANADDSNDENLVVVDNAEIAAQYLLEFDRRWAEAEAPIEGDDVNCEH